MLLLQNILKPIHFYSSHWTRRRYTAGISCIFFFQEKILVDEKFSIFII